MMQVSHRTPARRSVNTAVTFLHWTHTMYTMVTSAKGGVDAGEPDERADVPEPLNSASPPCPGHTVELRVCTLPVSYICRHPLGLTTRLQKVTSGTDGSVRG